MIDSIAISHVYCKSPSDNFLVQKGWVRKIKSERPVWYKNEPKPTTNPRLTLNYLPNYSVFLTVVVSVPKMLFGHNATLPDENQVLVCLDKISEWVEAVSGIQFDARTANVVGVDYARDYQLGETKVIPRIQSLSKKTIPRRIRVLFDSSTLYFQTKSRRRQICIYSKFLEMLNNKPESAEIAKGNLRLEVRYRGSEEVKGLVQKLCLFDRTSKCLLTKDVSECVISDTEKLLDINKFEDEYESDLQRLIKLYSPARTMRLLGFKGFMDHFGERFFKIYDLGIKKDAYYRDLGDLRKAGICTIG